MGKEFSSFSKDFLITAFLAIAAFVATSGAGWLAFVSSANPHEAPLTYENDPLSKREIIESFAEGAGEGSIVRYAYYGEKLPEKLSADEVVDKRTNASWTRLIGYENKGTPQERMILSLIAYSQPTFIQKNDAWHYIEYGETTKENMDMYKREHVTQNFFWSVAYAANIFSGVGDGYVQYFVNGDWATVHAATSGTDFTSTSTKMVVGSDWTELKGSFFAIYRGFLPFDTSSIPLAATTTAAILNVYATTTTAFVDFGNPIDDDGNDYITVVQTSQATHTVLAKADYDVCGAVTNPTEGIDSGGRIDISSAATLEYKSFTLNATGRNWVKRAGETSSCSGTTGITCLGLRDGHDAVNSSVNQNTSSGMVFLPSEWTGTDKDPYLSVTYVTSSFAFWQFQDF